jgi:ribosomal protein L3 glutamine methyltransferase
MARRTPVTVRDLVRLGNSLLTRAEVVCVQSMGSPLWDAKYLTYFGLGLPYYEAQHLDARVCEPELLEVLRLFEERIARRIAAQYVTHEAFFVNRYFYVDENVLVPRSPIGYLLDKIVPEVDWTERRALDLCCGSGAIGITLALQNPSIEVDLTDVSEAALKVARKNVERFGLAYRVRVLKSDLFDKVEGPYSLIVTNPPYVPTDEYDSCAPEYHHEPRMALDAGPDGLDCVVPILERAPRYLTPTGTLVVEVGAQNEDKLVRRYPEAAFKWWRIENRREVGVFSLKNGYRLAEAKA